MKYKFITLSIITLLLSTCNEHHRRTIVLKGFQDQKEVIYQTETADYYLGFNDLTNYCNKKDNGEPNDFTFKQIIKFIQSYPNQPILIPDTLGTIMAKERDVNFNDSDSLIRVRDQAHPYAYITEEVRWAILYFAKRGNLKIFNKKLNCYLDTIIVDKVNTDWYGETNIILTNDSTIFSVLRWIK